MRFGVVTRGLRIPITVPALQYLQPPTTKAKRYAAVIAGAYMLGTLVLFIQAVLTTKYNNFTIFSHSWQHLSEHLPLYNLYPDEYFDYYLYHPTFPILFLPFAILPSHAGLLLWLLFNSAMVLYAIYQLPMDWRKKNLMSGLLLIEIMNAIQSSQSNPLMVALMLLTLVQFEKKNVKQAALFTCILFFIKGYGAIIGILFLFYGDKKKFLKYCFAFGIAGSLLPLLVISPMELIHAYKDWFHLISSATIKEDGSLFGMIHAMRHEPYLISTGMDKIVLVLAVIGLLTAIICTAVAGTQQSRFTLAAYLLIWIVIFNQSTESPTYAIAVTGAVMALVMCSQKFIKWFLLGLLIFVASLAPTDLVPTSINHLAVSFQLKALPCLIILLFLQSTLFFHRRQVIG
ncbi:glycosyltransferase family 87 protein [Chitinophaga sp. Hz27]|uniref:glycosyltransferase family 87 protein n=1 Tax=Chitinophaga sp. Hz27 TaxID=3347169 RepID=UPI0035E07FAE